MSASLKQKTWPVATALLALIVSLYAFGVCKSVPLDISKNLLNGSVQKYSIEYRVIFDYLYDCGYEDVVVNKPMPECLSGCALTQIPASPEHWKNAGIAEYFGLKSVCLNPPVEEPVGD